MGQGTGTPGIGVNVATGNLQREIAVLDGVAALVGTSYENIGLIKIVYSLDDAVNKGYTLADEPFLYAALKQYYNELGGSQKLYVMGVEDTMTMTDMLTSTNANGLKKLLVAHPDITIVCVCRKPANSYSPGTGFLDTDVPTAVTAAKTLCQYQQSINRPIRVLIEGRIVDVTQEWYEPNTANNTYVGVVIGNDVNDGSACVALTLARAVKYASHIKIGNGQNGSLSIAQAFIGNKALEAFYPEELDSFSNSGYILLHTRPGQAGYFFGVDNMAGSDDYSILVHGRIIDKAQRIATATTTPFIETSFRVAADGTVDPSDANYLEGVIKQQLNSQMAGQISGSDVIIPLNQDLINNPNLQIQVKVQPLGYLTWLTINLGLTTNI